MTDQVKILLKGKPMTEQEVKLDKAAATYVKIRDKRSELKKAWEVEDLKLKDQIDTIEGFFLETLRDLGIESARTKHGTIYRSLDVKPSCEDWNAFYAWIAENEAFDALERRVKKSFITQFMEDNKDELPPGITVVKEYIAKVLRK
jgi:hypothetical protein